MCRTLTLHYKSCNHTTPNGTAHCLWVGILSAYNNVNVGVYYKSRGDLEFLCGVNCGRGVVVEEREGECRWCLETTGIRQRMRDNVGKLDDGEGEMMKLKHK